MSRAILSHLPLRNIGHGGEERETRRMAEWIDAYACLSRQTQVQVPPRRHNPIHTHPPTHTHTHTWKHAQRAGAASAATSSKNSQLPETWPYCSIHAPSQRATC
ncbi:hypothetical protein GGP41_006700 [Bipolaris sorokiniana]|uniref:Uncharacterized protein n=1 Tax=Cochliobolus sativus TaxID=45130 RepID=A0A8H6DZN2_COCSA|nr:hypothetical protein GGP41_006700 [Bipolaris sorokiniana]